VRGFEEAMIFTPQLGRSERWMSKFFSRNDTRCTIPRLRISKSDRI
jgi:hypothetical protein